MVKDSMDLWSSRLYKSPDGRRRGLPLREALRVLMDAIMDAEVVRRGSALTLGERSPDRLTHRNGYRSRCVDTRVGTMELRIPKLTPLRGELLP